ncbi:parB-like partition protein [Gottschalkia acidurici 9a]|uniref:ParB-like partition protein n=1 Tax=Gottschalkia acidurici (strain ATCC 7906 / DSM 604 / BCRC 14475 / CIP 104303 / KCTC 5404 / NCIMB 10678 / 9a) TaxID=1128398 RepID=K0B4V6_GOTA9|nr:nucleoid occlusion protein [Gottschalkia acidurici]AFS79910.1 parB-like partition protein [Gottschalkia acidurici 9a]
MIRVFGEEVLRERIDVMGNLNSEITYIPIGQIKPNPYQPRKVFARRSLEELSQSIKTFGILQPISVRKVSDQNYELIAGERRLRATELAQIESIPAVIVDVKDKDSAMLALLENLQREDLNFIEESEGYYNLINDHGFTQQELAEQLGKSQSTIANKLRILRLSESIKKDIIDNSLTERHARALLRLPDESLQKSVLKKVIQNELTVKRTENLISDLLEDITKQKETEHKSKQKIKNLINFRIYLNTLKNAYTAIKDSGVEAEYEQKDMGDFIEVKVKIPKN